MQKTEIPPNNKCFLNRSQVKFNENGDLSVKLEWEIWINTWKIESPEMNLVLYCIGLREKTCASIMMMIKWQIKEEHLSFSRRRSCVSFVEFWVVVYWEWCLIGQLCYCRPLLIRSALFIHKNGTIALNCCCKSENCSFLIGICRSNQNLIHWKSVPVFLFLKQIDKNEQGMNVQKI